MAQTAAAINCKLKAHRMSCRSQAKTTAVLLATLVLVASIAVAARVPVILSTDVGNEIDDQWVVAYVLTDPQDFDVLGIISAHAPSPPDPSAHYTFLVLRNEVERHLDMVHHPPLFEGSSVALRNATTPETNGGVNFIVASSKRFFERASAYDHDHRSSHGRSIGDPGGPRHRESHSRGRNGI